MGGREEACAATLLIREGIVRILRDFGIDVVAQAGSAESLQKLVGVHAPDVVTLDIRMPPTFTDEGLRAAAELRATHPATAVLVLSQHLGAACALRLLREPKVCALHRAYALGAHRPHVARAT